MHACERTHAHMHTQRPSFPAASSRAQSTAGNAGRVSRYSLQWGWMADLGPRDHPPSLTCSGASRKDGVGPYIGVQFTLFSHFTRDIITSVPSLSLGLMMLYSIFLSDSVMNCALQIEFNKQPESDLSERID